MSRHWWLNLNAPQSGYSKATFPPTHMRGTFVDWMSGIRLSPCFKGCGHGHSHIASEPCGFLDALRLLACSCCCWFLVSSAPPDKPEKRRPTRPELPRDALTAAKHDAEIMSGLGVIKGPLDSGSIAFWPGRNLIGMSTDRHIGILSSAQSIRFREDLPALLFLRYLLFGF